MRWLGRIIVYSSFLILNWFCASAQNRVGIAYYDVDHLYDTLPSPFYNDTDHTPQGRLRWTPERYRHKVAQVAGVIDSMRMPIVGLWSVENEQVVRDIAATCEGGYSYIHRTLNSLMGMDFALLYYGDAFFPHRVEEGRRYLYVEGLLRRDTVGIVLCSDARMASWVVGDLRDERPGVRLVVMGRVGTFDAAAWGLHDLTARAARAGRGNVRSRNGWQMRDRILADTAFKALGGDVFARRYLVDQKSGYPTPTYERKAYRGGAGYALPVFGYIR